jgi:transposase
LGEIRSHTYQGSRKGNIAVKKQVFVRGSRASLEALLTLDGIIARTVAEGSMTKDTFLEYIEFVVVGHLVESRQFTDISCRCHSAGPLSFLVMDNASIRHDNEVLELADQFGITPLHVMLWFTNTLNTGIRIEYLLPYYPDLNPIEEAFSKIKHFLCHRRWYSL